MENRAFNMDCMEAMRSMPDQCFDLAVVDPPYGIDAANMNLGLGKQRNVQKFKTEISGKRAGIKKYSSRKILSRIRTGIEKTSHFWRELLHTIS